MPAPSATDAAMDSSTGIVFSERLLPKLWVWVAVSGVIGGLAVAYSYVLGSAAGFWVFGIGLTLSFFGLVASSPKIVVCSAYFQAGPARLPSQWIGKVSALDQDTSDAARTIEADPSAHLMLRLLAAPRAVIVAVADPDDPHPYWLVSSRRPEKLAHALVQVRPPLRNAGLTDSHHLPDKQTHLSGNAPASPTH
jgi:hypothetical protein